jgi:hypothetical protein
MYNFGDAAGVARCALACAGLETVKVMPATWKKALGLRAPPLAQGEREKMSKSEYRSYTNKRRFAGKRAAIDMALRLYPDLAAAFSRSKDDGRAEALLMAHWYAYAVKRDVKPARQRKTKAKA